jgi:glycosyltransferase involved in cell wall biosynthesis
VNLAPKISVVVTTYNWPAALDRVLDGLSRQTYGRYEVLVADDGSTEQTAACVAAWRKRGVPGLQHLWQPDDGFRAAAARNRAVAAGSGEYLVFLDGDCLVRPDFLHRHAALAASGRFVAGNRVLLSPAFSRRVLDERMTVTDWKAWRWAWARLGGRVNRWASLLRLPAGGWRDTDPVRWEGVKTCNLAVWRKDFLAVNGLDERYQGWGYEDSDLAIRLIRHGVARRDGRFATTVLHLWHREHERAGTEDNLARLQALRVNPRVRAQLGVDQYPT